MAILYKRYNADTRTDDVWYKSSNIFYSRFIENENDNNGQLYITFNNGLTYLYKDVDMPKDYLLFKSGDIYASQGKAFNKNIRPNYECKKVEGRTITELQNELDMLLEEEKKKKENGEEQTNQTE